MFTEKTCTEGMQVGDGVQGSVEGNSQTNHFVSQASPPLSINMLTFLCYCAFIFQMFSWQGHV